jgi:hypothetical protein
LVAVGASLAIEDAIAVDTDFFSLTSSFGSIWIASAADRTVVRLDATAVQPG